MTAQNRSRLTMLAGWLFADLFLVLLVAGLAALPAKSSVGVGEPSTSSSPPTSLSVSSSPSPPRPQGLDPHHLDFDIALSPDAFRNGAADELLELVNDRLARSNPTHRRVGFVLVFASDDKNHIDRAEDTATEVLDLLHSRSPDFASSTGFGYWNGDHDNFSFKVFFLN